MAAGREALGRDRGLAAVEGAVDSLDEGVDLGAGELGAGAGGLDAVEGGVGELDGHGGEGEEAALGA